MADLDIHDLEDWEARCSACDLKIVWECSSLEIRFTTAYELRTPQLVDQED